MSSPTLGSLWASGIRSTASESGNFNFSYQLGQTIAGVSDTLTLAGKGAANNDDIVGLLKWFDLT